jgi:hypothetical protein
MKRKFPRKCHFAVYFFEKVKERKEEKRFWWTIEMKQKVEIGIIFVRN